MEKQVPASTGSVRRSRSSWTIVTWLVAVVAIVGLSTWAVVALTGRDDLQVAAQRVDEWVVGWNDDDPQAIAAIFTQDGFYLDPLDRGGSSKDEILTFAQAYVAGVWNVRRTGEGTITESGTFIFPVSFDWASGTDSGEIEVELDGDLVSRLEWLNWTVRTDE